MESRAGSDASLDFNFWHWRAIVEAVRRSGVLADATVDGLHQQFCGTGLSGDEAKRAAEALQAGVLAVLAADERLLLDGRTTREPDDGVMHHDDPDRNYSTDRAALELFVEFCRACAGFEVC